MSNVEDLLAMWDQDAREHLVTVGQHQYVSLECCADMLREAIAKDGVDE